MSQPSPALETHAAADRGDLQTVLAAWHTATPHEDLHAGFHVPNPIHVDTKNRALCYIPVSMVSRLTKHYPRSALPDRLRIDKWN
jgi:hypothetical protein